MKPKLKSLTIYYNTFVNRFTAAIICLFLLLPAQLSAANITVKLDRSQVIQDETFHLIFEADSDIDDSPNFSALYEDFEILNSGQSTNMRMINGQYSLKKSWDLTLISSKAGTFTIPSIPFGKDYSPALRIKVSKTANNQGTYDNAEIFVEVEVDNKSAYIESEIIYTARLVRTIDITQGSFSELKTSDPDAIIINLGNIPQYTATRNGKRYVINEVRYAVYPQHSGKLTLEPLLFEGRISHSNARSLLDQFFQAGKIKRIRSKSLDIKVKTKPSSIDTKDWLPAKKLSLIEEWSADLDDAKVGEPVTRTIQINTEGFTAEQLPEISFKDLDNLKQYPDQAIMENTNTANGITSIKQIKVAIIPTRSGQFKIPEISIPWWNTKTNKKEIARLPETLINATGSANLTNTEVMPEIALTQPAPKQITTRISDPGFWPWISLALAGGWLTTIIFIFITKRKPSDMPSALTPRPAIKTLEKAVKKACDANDANATKNALILWARTHWNNENINSLADIAERSNTAFSYSISQLNTSLYGAQNTSWNGDDLFKNFDHFKSLETASDDINTSILEPLYK